MLLTVGWINMTKAMEYYVLGAMTVIALELLVFAVYKCYVLWKSVGKEDEFIDLKEL